MLRAARSYSFKAVPFEAQPKNRYSATRSKFNVKPVPTQGLIYNPPASMPSVTDTPRAFLPPNDPRLKVLADKYKTYTQAELDDMPIIYATRKDNSLTPDLVREMVTLRLENPDKWTVAALSAKFNVDRKKVNVVTGVCKERQLAVLQELEKQQKKWLEKKRHARDDRWKRKQMWLRSEF